MSEESYLPVADRYVVLSIGLGGVGGYSRARVEPWGTTTRIHTSIPDSRIACYYGDLEERGYVVLLPVDAPDFVSRVVSGPMLDVDLPAGQESPCPDIPGIMRAGLEGAFADLAERKAADSRWRGLDSVSLPVWLAFWREGGARIGKREGRRIRWEDGTEDQIPPAAQRWTVAR